MYCPKCLKLRNRKQWMNRIYDALMKKFRRECPFCLYSCDEGE
jgi:hypothetical protein